MLIDKIKKTIQKYNLINEDDKLLIGVSGGPDSMALLNVLQELGYNICVAHINHGIRENAVNDQKCVEDFCEARNIPCFVKEVKLLEMQSGLTIEELGRVIRYEFFDEILNQEGCTKIVTAHNANDNAETVIMNMIRGSGLSGLKGIGASRDNIIRPLIETTRDEVEAYCDEMHLNPCHDESNDEAVYTRNKVRLEVLPYIIENINSNAINNINRMAELVALDEGYIRRNVNEAYEDCLILEEKGRVVCNLRKFNKLDEVIKRRLIIKFISKALGHAKDIEKVHIEDILKLCENNVGNKYLTPNKNIKVMINKGRVEYTKVI